MFAGTLEWRACAGSPFVTMIFHTEEELARFLQVKFIISVLPRLTITDFFVHRADILQPDHRQTSLSSMALQLPLREHHLPHRDHELEGEPGGGG